MSASRPAQVFLHLGLACFVLLAKFLGVPVDPDQIAHDRGKGDGPYSLEDLARIASKLGLTARLRPTPWPSCPDCLFLQGSICKAAMQ